MAIKIKNKNTDVDYNVGDAYGGGFLDIDVTPSGSCPVIRFNQTISIPFDRVEISMFKAVTKDFLVYDTEIGVVVPTNINPNLTEVPIVTATPNRVYYKVDGVDLTLFKLIVDNSQNYLLQFCSTKTGALTSGGYPVLFVDVEKDSEGAFNILTLSGTDFETIYMRFKAADGQADRPYTSNNYIPLPTSGGGVGGGGGGEIDPPPPTGDASAPYAGVPLLLHVWGMFGNDQPNVFQQGTYQDDVAAIERIATQTAIGDAAYSRLPWFAVRNNTPTNYLVSNWVNSAPQQDKISTPIYHSFLMTKAVLLDMIGYTVEAGVQGFMMLNYANDGYLSLFRRLFRTLTQTERRGLKACWSTNFGGQGREEYDAHMAANNYTSAYMQTVIQFAEDIVQPWYATALKGGQQRPIIYCLIDVWGGDPNAAQKVEELKNIAWQDLARIKDWVFRNTGTQLGETFNVLMTTGIAISADGADDTGNKWNAITEYYLQPQGAFSNSGVYLDQLLNKTSLATTVPMISWGYDSDARWFFQYQQLTGNKFPVADVKAYLPTLITKLKNGMASGKGMRLALAGQVGEYAEQGQDIFPNINGDRGYLDIFKSQFRV